MGAQPQPRNRDGSGCTVTSTSRQLITWAPALVAGVGVAVASLFVTLPALFSYSDAVMLGAIAFGVALGLGLMLPEGWLYSDDERLSHAFKQYHGVSGDRADVALKAVASSHRAANRLRRADNGFREDLKSEVHGVADRLDDVARLIFYKPDELPKYQALIIRAESVIGAVEDHAKVRDRAVGEAEIQTSRDMAQAGLESLLGALDASQQREVAAILGRIEANVATAEVLLRPRT